MKLSFRKGVLKAPIKIFYAVTVPLAIFLLLLCGQILHNKQRQQTIFCSRKPPEEEQRGSRTHPDHPGCFKDPVYFNTWRSCQTCFRPNVAKFSENFTEIKPEERLFPRGPPNYFKPRASKQQDIVEDVIILPTSVCVDTCPYLVALQLSVSDRLDERNSIRRTWASAAKTKVWPHASLNADFQILFVLAHQSKSSERNAGREGHVEMVTTPEMMTRIQTEANRYGDILYLDMIDSYFNLTLKIVSALRWVRYHCPRTKFFLKVDADTFVNVPLLMDLLIHNEDLLEFSIVGHIYMGDRYVFRSGRWAVSKEVYPVSMFPVYAAGCVYVISQRATSRIVDLSPYFPMLHLEDAYVTGILGKAAKVRYFFKDLQGMFADYHNDKWDWCWFLNDTLVAGTGVNRKFKKHVIWSGFVLNDWMCVTHNLLKMPCYCEDEFERAEH